MAQLIGSKKGWAILAILVSLAIWPGLHHVLADQVRLDPWRLAGWSMYCQPKGPVEVRVLTADRDELPVSAELKERIADASSLGALANANRHDLPSGAAVIEVSRPWLDRRGRLAHRVERYRVPGAPRVP